MRTVGAVITAAGVALLGVTLYLAWVELPYSFPLLIPGLVVAGLGIGVTRASSRPTQTTDHP